MQSVVLFRSVMLQNDPNDKKDITFNHSRIVAFDGAFAAPEDVWSLEFPLGTRYVRVRKMGTELVSFEECIHGQAQAIRKLGTKDYYSLDELRSEGTELLARETFLGLVNQGLLVIGVFGSTGIGMITDSAAESISMIITLAMAGEGIVIPTTQTAIVKTSDSKTAWINEQLTLDFVKIFDLGLRLLSTSSN